MIDCIVNNVIGTKNYVLQRLKKNTQFYEKNPFFHS